MQDDPIGKFLRVDPAGRFLRTNQYGFPVELNLYTYCGNNSIIFIDPSGQWLKGIIGGVVSGVGFAFIVTGHPYIGVPLVAVGTALTAWDIIEGDIEKDIEKGLDKIKEATEGWEDKDGDGFPDGIDDDTNKDCP